MCVGEEHLSLSVFCLTFDPTQCKIMEVVNKKLHVEQISKTNCSQTKMLSHLFLMLHFFS